METARSWWSWTRMWARRLASARPTGKENNLQTLLISPDENYRERLQQVFDRRGWRLECVATLGYALNHLRSRPAQVVVYDSLPADDNWRDVLNALRLLPHRPCVLLTSSVIDESFGDEVVRLHGYDVFSRHADEDEIARTINSAWFWKQHYA